MGTIDFKLEKVHPFAKRPVNINILKFSAPKLALVLYVNVCSKFYKD